MTACDKKARPRRDQDGSRTLPRARRSRVHVRTAPTSGKDPGHQIDKTVLAMIISFCPFFSTISRLSLRGTERLSLFPCHHRSHPRFLSAQTNKPSMFIYDGIRSQLEWNSTLSPAKAILPAAETKFLRKVRHHPSSAGNSRFTQPVDRHHRDDRCEFRLGGSIKRLIFVSGPNTNSVEKLAALRRAGVNVGEPPSR